jgi:hypothetical protein
MNSIKEAKQPTTCYEIENSYRHFSQRSCEIKLCPGSMITDNRIFSRNFAVYGRLR